MCKRPHVLEEENYKPSKKTNMVKIVSRRELMGHHQYLWPRRQVEGCFIMANDLLNLLLCHEEQLKSPHSGGVTLGSISSKQKNAFNNWTEVEKKFFSITFSDSQQLWNFFLESPLFLKANKLSVYSVLLIFQSSRNLGKLNGHTVQMVMTNQWMPFIKKVPSLEKRPQWPI